MGCGGSKETYQNEDEVRSREIDVMLKSEKAKERFPSNTVKILLLGTGESGKSTVLKQMHLIYGKGFEDREAYVTVVRSNLIQSAQVVLDAMPFLQLNLDEEAQKDAAVVNKVNLDDLDHFQVELRDALLRLYANKDFKQAIMWGNQYQLNDSVVYLFDHIREMSKPDYIPSDNDILRARVRSTGITENTFTVGKLAYTVIDVGGQRSERRKWAHCFDSVQVLLYLVAISEYDQKLWEDEHVARLYEAIEVYRAMVNSRYFRTTTFILFLNKVDLFKEKLTRHPLNQYYSNYTGTTENEALQYMLDKFLAETPEGKSVYPHFTCATDTTQVKVVMGVVQEMILKEQMRSAGLM